MEPEESIVLPHKPKATYTEPQAEEPQSKKGKEPQKPKKPEEKPPPALSYRYVPGQGRYWKSHLVVYLNGLILTQDGWYNAIDHLQRRWAARNVSNRPALLTYDRYGQGKSQPDPADKEYGNTHDIRESVQDLHVLVKEIWKTKHPEEGGARSRAAPLPSPPEPQLIFVSNSIGCVIARLYAAAYPGAVKAVLFLDSNIANSDLVSIFPNPDAPGFSPADLPKDTTIRDLRHARSQYRAFFHPSLPNPEHLDRRNIADLLPHSDKPPLKGPKEKKGPCIMVVGHDPDTFAEEGERGIMHVHKSLTNAFMNPAWAKYNEGLTSLTDKDRTRGPYIAKGCGHFIQRDDPALVAELTEQLLEMLKSASTSSATFAGVPR
ncbi:hypothetical protein Hte_000524 [Hypoxylon texense]